MTSYPMLRLIDRFGGWIAALLSLLPLAGAIWFVAAGWTPWWLVGGVAVGIFVFVATRSYVELIRVMTDMLLPK